MTRALKIGSLKDRTPIKLTLSLDPDLHLIYGAPVDGVYRLEFTEAAAPSGDARYQRDTGLASLATPAAPPASAGLVDVRLEVTPLDETAAASVLGPVLPVFVLFCSVLRSSR